MSILSVRRVLAIALLVVGGAVPAQDTSSPSPGAMSLKGQFLVAAPTMRDPRFAETVIFMVDHDGRGAMGLIVNKTLGKGRLGDILKGFGAPVDDAQPGAGQTIRFGFGGPVERTGAFILHSSDYRDGATVPVTAGVSLSRQVDVLTAIAQGRGPKRSLFVLGYSGWAPNQLETELARDDWLSAPSDDDTIFADDQAAKWPAAMKRAGVKL